jgi:hypothetical protein
MIGEKVERFLPVDRGEWLSFACIHIGVCVAAGVAASARAAAAAVVVSLLATLRYFSMALAAKWMGRDRGFTMLAASLWAGSFVALAAVLFFFGDRGGGLLPWAGAAALAGPAAATLCAAAKGIARFSGRYKEAAS